MYKLFCVKRKELEFLFIQLLLVCTFSSVCLGQISYEKHELHFPENYSSTALVSADLNNDQQDDLILFDKSYKVKCFLNNSLQGRWLEIAGPSFKSEVWSALVVDLNNDGKKELVLGTSSQPVRIFTFDPDKLEFVPYWTNDIEFFIQNMNAVDINADGFLDLFFCDDQGKNKLYLNDSNGGFTLAEDYNFNVDSSDKLGGNYSSVFIDFDLDGDLDLYMSKCFSMANSSEDPRRINQLFVNQGDGTYIEQAVDFNIADGAQSWTSDFADLDLDGDLDLVVLNHFEPIGIYERKGDVFEAKPENQMLFPGSSYWQLSYYDVDNDGLEDMIITGDDLFIYMNKGDFKFEKLTYQSYKYAKATSYTIGDYNQDGFMDIVRKGGSITGFSFHRDALMLATPNSNHWVGFELKGLHQHAAAGARVELFSSDGKVQNRFVKYGHSYGIQNSPKLHFGLGTSSIDSVRIYWPSGHVELLYNLPSKQYYHVHEHTCIQAIKKSTLRDPITCVGTKFKLKAPADNFVEWTNGSNLADISYQDTMPITAIYGQGECTLKASTLYPVYTDTSSQVTNEILRNGLLDLCAHESILITVPDTTANWSDGTQGKSFNLQADQTVAVKYTDACVNYTTTFERQDGRSDFLVPLQSYPIEEGGNIQIDVKSPTAKWYWDANSQEQFYQGSEYLFNELTADTSFYIEDFLVLEYSDCIGMKAPEMTNYHPSNMHVRITFEVLEAIRLRSVDVSTSIAGDRLIQIRNEASQNIFLKQINIQKGISTIDLDVNLMPGKYTIGTMAHQNKISFGTTSPYLSRYKSESISYPIEDERSAIRILKNSLSDKKGIYYFFNWKLEAIEKDSCSYGIYPVQLKLQNSTTNTIESAILRYNNPASQELNISLESTVPFLKIYNMNGTQMWHDEQISGTVQIDLRSWPKGLYFMTTDKQVYKLVIQ